MNLNFVKSTSWLVAIAVSASLAPADPLDIHRNDAVQIVFTQDLRADFNEPGDRIVARVEKDPELPRDTILSGRILRVHPANRYRAASMDMVFTSMKLPKGAMFNIDAVPAPANDPHLTRGADGRIVAAYKPGEETAYVFGGTVGGLILGGIGHRPIRGAVFGAIIGSIAGAFDRQANANVVIRKGEKMVAVFSRDVAPAPDRSSEGWHRNEGSYPAAPATSNLPQIQINGTPMKFPDTQPYRDNGEVMVPLEYTADQLNLVATIHEDGNITVDGPDSSVQLRLNSASCNAPTSKAPLPHQVQQHNGVVYAPVEMFARIVTDPITVDGAKVGR